MVSIVIPAYNEARTVGALIASVVRHPKVREVIVVDDGSVDATSGVATSAGARVIRLDKKAGKAAAMGKGVSEAREDIILFLDGDTGGFTDDKIDRIIAPVESGAYGMYVAIISRRNFWLNRILRVFPILGGTRAVRRGLWDAVPGRYKKGFQIEIALNYFSRRTPYPNGFEVVNGITHVIKEKKRGLIYGFGHRLVMIGHILSISFQLYIVHALSEALSSLIEISPFSSDN